MKKITVISLALAVAMIVANVAQAGVWRVRQNRHWGAPAGGYANMPDYIEPAAAMANAAFDGTTANDTWNSWDVDTRYGSPGGYNFIQNVRVGGLNPDDNVAQETLYSGEGLPGSTVTIKTIAQSGPGDGPHSPWYDLPITGPGFDQLVGGQHSAGRNGADVSTSYTVQIGGLTPGNYVFYSYALNVGARGDILPYYSIALNGGTVSNVYHSAYTEGSAASGVLMSTTVGGDGLLTIVYTAAGFTGPAFQFAKAPEPATMSVLGTNSLEIANHSSATVSAGTHFGSMPTNSIAITNTFVVTNSGESVLYLTDTSKVVLTGDTSYFSVNTSSMTTGIAANASTSFEISFNPTATGSWTGVVTIANSDTAHNPYSFAIRGDAIGGPSHMSVRGTNSVEIATNASASVSEGTDFGPVFSDAMVIINTLAIENLGGVALYLTDPEVLALTGDSGHFVVITNGMTTNIAASASTSFQISYNPTDVGTWTGVVSIANSDANRDPYRFSIRGVTKARTPQIGVLGTNSLAIANGAPVTVPAGTDFGIVPKNASLSHVFSITNSGSDILYLTNSQVIALTGDTAFFAISTNGMTTTIAIGASTTFTISFNPTSVGTKTGLVTIASSDTNANPYIFAVGGEGVAQAMVWRVRQNYTDAGSGGYSNMPDYIEPAAAAANAVFGGTTADDTWNSWDVDVRQGNMGGYNYVKGVAATPWAGGGSGYSTLFSGDLASTVRITSLNNSGQHNPWNGLPTSGPGFEQLVGGHHSGGNNNSDQSSTYTLEISGLTAGGYWFYSYALNNDYNAGFGNYTISLNAAAGTLVNASSYIEGGAGSGVLLSTTVGLDGKLTIVYSASAGLTGPAFQFAKAPEPATMSVLGTNSLEIANHSSATVSAGTHFGSLFTNSIVVTNTFVVANLGGSVLYLTDTSKVVLTGDTSYFSVNTGSMTTNIAANASTSFEISFNPTAPGTWTGVVTIANSDTAHNPYSFAIRGDAIGGPAHMSVRGTNLVEIATNAPASVSEGTDFGPVFSDAMAITNTLAIENLGGVALYLTDPNILTLTGDTSCFAVITNNMTTNIAVSSSTSFQISYNPTNVGTWTGVVSIANSDTNRNPYRFSIRGVTMARTPQIGVLGTNSLAIANGAPVTVPEGTDFGIVPKNASLSHVFSITNSGSDTLYLTNSQVIALAGDTACFSISTNGTATTIAIGASTTFTISFNPTSVGTKTGLVTIASSDTNANPYIFAVGGESVARSMVWRVRQNYSDGGNGGYNNMPDYIEPAAAAANAVFGGTAANDTWNSWDVDNRGGNMGGWNFIKGVAATPWAGGGSGYSTLFSGDLASTVTIKSLNNYGQHNPAYGLPTSGPGFDQLFGNQHSAGINSMDPYATYRVQISGLTAGNYFFYSYARKWDSTIPDLGYYEIALNGGSVTQVNGSSYAEGSSASGVLLSTTVGSDGLLTIVYTAAGFTGPAFQFAKALEPTRMSVLGTNSLEIVTNSLASLSAGTYFGSRDTNSIAITNTFVVNNSGGSVLYLTDTNTVVITGDTGYFSVNTSGMTTNIAEGASTFFTISFNPTNAGTWTGVVTIANSDTSRNPYSFSIQGDAVGGPSRMSVFGPDSVEIANGASSSAEAGTHFGAVFTNTAVITNTFEIKNLGGEALYLTSPEIIVITGDTDYFAVITNGMGTNIAPNASSSFRISYNPSVLGTWTGVVSIANSDTNRNPYSFSILGVTKARTPQIGVLGTNSVAITNWAPASVSEGTDFGIVPRNVTRIRVFSITNSGSDTLYLTNSQIIELTGDTNSFSVSTNGLVATIEAGTSTTFTISFQPDSVGEKTGLVTIASSDTNANPYVFAVRAESVQQAMVWRVRQNYTAGGTGGYNDMPDYIEPAAAAANSVFEGTTGNDTWNSWDVDVRGGSMGGYNYIQGVPVYGGVINGGGGNQGAEALETLFSGDLASTVRITSVNNAGQHNPAYGLPVAGPEFGQLVGSEHSAGVNSPDPASTYTVQISGLTPGGYYFYSYARKWNTTIPDLGYYDIALNGATAVRVNGSAYTNGSPDSGVLLTTTVGTNGLLTIVYTAAGFTGPAFQFGTFQWPRVDNEPGATEAGAVSFALNGHLVWEGASLADLTVYWGTEDGGTNVNSWSSKWNFGISTNGTYSHKAGVAVNTKYYYRYCATNMYGSAWADPAASFMSQGGSVFIIR